MAWYGQFDCAVHAPGILPILIGGGQGPISLALDLHAPMHRSGYHWKTIVNGVKKMNSGGRTMASRGTTTNKQMSWTSLYLEGIS